MKPIQPLTPLFLAVARASGTIVECEPPVKRLSVRAKLFVVLVFILCCIAGLALGLLL